MTPQRESLQQYLASRRKLVDETLDRELTAPATPPQSIHEAMRYAVLGGGKRSPPGHGHGCGRGLRCGDRAAR